MDPTLIKLFFKYCLVGASGMGIDFSITFLGKEKLKINSYIANSLGFMAAVTHNFFFNKIWTFEDGSTHVGQQYFTFFIIALLGLVINNLFIYLFIKLLNLNFYLAKLIAIGVSTGFNFFLNFFLTFAI